MGLNFFKKRYEKRKITLEGLERLIQEKIDEHEKTIDDFIANNISELQDAVSYLKVELESFDVNFLHPKLRGVATNFISTTKKQWKIPSTDEQNYFEEVRSRAAKLVIAMGKNFRLLFAVNPPELEGINNAIKRIGKIISDYEKLKTDRKLLSLKEIHKKLQELKELRIKINEKENKIEKLKSTLNRMNESEKSDFDDRELNDCKKSEKILSQKITEIENELQKIIGIVRKPLKLYAHMVGERVQISSIYDLLDGEINELASKTFSEIIKGSIRIKDSQRREVLNSLEAIHSQKIKDSIDELEKLKKEINEVRFKIKVLEAEQKARPDSEKRKETIQKEMTQIEKSIENDKIRFEVIKKEIEGLIRETFEKERYEISFQD